MKSQFKTMLCGGVALAAISLASPVYAQETTSNIRASISNADGVAVSGAKVTITNTATGITRTVNANSSGSIFLKNLPVGGPYTIAVVSESGRIEKVENIYLQLGSTYSANISLSNNADVSMEEIVITAERLSAANVAQGPNSVFDLSDLEGAPAINRDIKDIIRLDPRVYIDESNSDAIQCAGANPRFNSLTVDGVGLNDNFGLNSNGYPTERIPFPFSGIQQVAVEMAPFNVEYGSFTSCNVNAVTKSGTNTLKGSAFFDYTGDSYRGNSLEGDQFDNGDYSEKRYGATFGGPIIKDKLFFFAAYEKLEGAQLFDRGVEGSGAAREVQGVTQSQLDRIVTASRDLYGFDAGSLPSSLPFTDEKFLAKIDWNINDQHRFSFTFNYNDGFSISQSDNDDNELELSNHYYERGAKLLSYTGHLVSDWTDNFSTDIRLSHADLDNRQNSLIGSDVGEARIETSRGTYVYVGGDDSRQSNDLAYTTWNFKAAGTYQLDDHAITFGYERFSTDIFNLFLQHSNGEYRFNSVEDYENGTPSRVYYGNASTLNPNDAAADWGYAINTIYLQDEFSLPDSNLNITAGVRYDWYDNADIPRENANFVARNGFSNSANFDGRGIFLPRIGFNWDATDRMSVHGGIGLFSGGNPNVWLSNNYSNDGVSNIQIQLRDFDDDPNFTLFDDPTANGGLPISDVPARAQDLVAAGSSNTGVNAIDPDFKIPTQLKFALGTTIDFDAGMFGDDYRFGFDFLYSKTRNAATIIDSTLEQIGTAPDGRPLYFSVNRADADCAADVGSNPFGCNRWFNSDYILTNSEDSGRHYVLSGYLRKSHDNGIDWSLGYAYTDATDANPMTSAVAFSNFSGVTASDRNNLSAATSNWEIKHRFTGKFSWAKDFWDDNTTRLTVFASVQSGRPYGFTFLDGGGAFNGSFDEFGDGVDRGSLLYVPTGVNDPLVNFGPDFNTTTFFAFLENQGLMEYAGQILPRNVNTSRWWGKVDLKFEQELPTIVEGHKLSAFMVIENFTNLLNDDWGVQYHGGYFGNTSIVDARIDTTNNVYNFNEFVRRDPQSRRSGPSLWEIRFGVRYKF
ncbi:carboxypeptidase regulatory-like domain-containing protein [Temperatibacter marinus]|uniref:Carboxypeptidase regulatory-like domain-containing protein n=1 Tax=Temperatibacter marinus TaxID=1456591 RepID=A0AA52H888_9PROT|nr:carboxypeptidase regulatory-like domain-containing protein [Temperatibacter marinus]WND01584.1 carboxypeptidase regulatory-like domain-containing protein [Temperatibacter marinus]